MNLGLSFIYKTENLTAAARESMDSERKNAKTHRFRKNSNIHIFTKSQIFTDSQRVKYSQNTNFKIHRFTDSNCETTAQTIISLPSWIVQMPDHLTPFI